MKSAVLARPLGVADLRRLIAATAAVTGADFFRVLVQTLGECLRMERVVLGEHVGGKVRALAAWRATGAGGELFDLPDFDPAGTPGGAILDAGEVLIGRDSLGAPIRLRGGPVLGFLLATGDPAVVAGIETEILVVLAGRAAAEVERARTEDAFRLRAEARLDHQSALLELAQLRATSTGPALKVILPIAARALAVERVSYWSLVDGNDAITCEQLFVRSQATFSTGGRLEARELPAYFAALRTCRAIDAPDVATDARTSELCAYFAAHGIGAMLDVPVWRDGNLVGVLCHEHVGDPRAWSLEEQDFATSVAKAVSLVLEASARSRAEERYHLVSQATGELVWEWDLTTHEVSWTSALHTVFGYDSSLRSGLAAWWTGHIHPEDRERIDKSIHAVIQSPHAGWSGEYRFARADGSWASVIDRGFVTRDDSGRAIRMTGSMQDITSKKTLEARLLLADRMASMGTLAAGVAHEINNPLAYVKGNLEYVIECLAKHTDLDPDLLVALDEARQGAVRVAAIVRDLKTFSRADHEESGPVDLAAVASSALAMAWNEIRHRARLVKRFGEVPPVLATEARLGQVILNLVINAAQAIPEGATDANEVRIETGLAADGRVFLEVADTGPGMEPEVVRRIFDPFFTTKAVGEGTGLGLAICHSIVTSLGGEITVETAPGRGATFRVLLPVARLDDHAETGPSPMRTPRRRARVLVIDDDPSVATTVQRILSRDHEVETVPGGSEALLRLARAPGFDVVVCDVMMPGVSGMDVYAEVERLQPELARRIIFLTGGAFTPRTRAFLAATPQPCLGKPFEPDELRRTIAAMF